MAFLSMHLATPKPTLKQLQQELYNKATNKWKDIGIQLDIDEGQLDEIKSDTSSDSRACLREMLIVWLRRVDPPPSWSAIAEAIDFLGDKELASHLRSKYCSLQQWLMVSAKLLLMHLPCDLW